MGGENQEVKVALNWLEDKARELFPRWQWSVFDSRVSWEYFSRDIVALRGHTDSVENQQKTGIILEVAFEFLLEFYSVGEPCRSATLTIVLDDMLREAVVVVPGARFPSWSPGFFKDPDGGIWVESPSARCYGPGLMSR